LTPRINKIGNLVSNRHVPDEPSLSDYRYICFQTCNIATTRVTFRDPNITNWESHKDEQRVNLETIS
jgi:hypothetical protein